MSYRRIGQITEYRPVSRLNMEELAAYQRGLTDPSGGVLFARTKARDEKDLARQRILDLFGPQAWPDNLRMFTMPGIHWRFERILLGMREQGWMKFKPKPKHTYFTAVENDRAIFHAAIGMMPGVHTPNALVQTIKPQPFCEAGVKTKYAALFFANVDDLMPQPWNNGWDAAWLDYTGPMSVQRLNIIADFYRRCVRKVMIVTVLKARWDRDTSVAIERAGGHAAWLRKHLPGDVLHDIEYQDTVPMAQIAVRKLWRSPLC